MSQVNEFLLELFRSHGIDATVQNEWIAFPDRSLKANASIVREIKQPAGMSVQLDVRFEIAVGRIITESFAGIGETREAAASDAVRNFTMNSFHVLLAVFFRPEDEQVTQEKWIIGGKQRRVTVGNAGVRGKPPVQAAQLADCLKRFEQLIQQKNLGTETHWIRLYYGQSQGKAIACEILLDNEVWEEIQSEAATFDWPSDKEFYSVRVFLIIAGENEHSITPESAIVHLAEIMAANPSLTEDEVYQALVDAGIPDNLADRAYKFTQVAWGRLLLDRMKINFSADYICFDTEGRVTESGRLADEPCFAAATRLASRYVSTPAFQPIALSSADVNVVNNALKKGSRPEDLVTAPVGIFIEEPTAAGLQKAQQVISEQIASIQKQSEPKNETPKQQTNSSWRRLWKR